ncbi:MAG: hypothetical protein P4L51_20375 [Puia sp.]|nr:hypothetical protein [Puia sp.]
MTKNFRMRTLMLALFAWPALLVQGQYNIVPLPAGNIYLKAQLWNLTVSSTASATVEANIHLEMKDAQTSQTVLTAVSNSFQLSRGAKAVQMQLLEPIAYSYAPGITVDRSSNGMLPVGKYQVCYQLYLNGEIQTAVADDCEEIEVEPLSPPLLTMPENDSTVNTATPYFTWTPPAPASMFTNLNYDLLISEVYDGQSVTDAIQKNLPLQQAQGLQQPFFTFPLQGPQLEEGKRYVWQIIARDQQQYGGKSEVWSFRMPDKKITAANANLSYLVMDEKATGVETIAPGDLYIKYVSPTSSYEAVVTLRNEQGAVLQTLRRQIRQGDNYLDIPLGGRFQSQQVYAVFLTDRYGQSHTLSFKIK